MWRQLFWVEQQLQEATPDPKVMDPGCFNRSGQASHMMRTLSYHLWFLVPGAQIPGGNL